jgi:hypothetical protein
MQSDCRTRLRRTSRLHHSGSLALFSLGRPCLFSCPFAAVGTAGTEKPSPTVGAPRPSTKTSSETASRKAWRRNGILSVLKAPIGMIRLISACLALAGHKPAAPTASQAATRAFPWLGDIINSPLANSESEQGATCRPSSHVGQNKPGTRRGRGGTDGGSRPAYASREKNESGHETRRRGESERANSTPDPPSPSRSGHVRRGQVQRQGYLTSFPQVAARPTVVSHHEVRRE